MDPREIVSWLGLAFRIVVSLAVIGAALAVVRPKLPRTGWLLAAAAGADALSICCSRALWRGVREMDADVVEGAYTALSALDFLQVLVLGALVVAVVATMASEGRRAPPRA
jgi:hypothetical protein